MDFYEPLPEFDANGIYLDFEDRRNGIDEWFEGEFTEWMCSRCLSVITDGEYEVVRMLFGLSDDEPKSYDKIAVIMNLSRKLYLGSTIRNLEKAALRLSFNKKCDCLIN